MQLAAPIVGSLDCQIRPAGNCKVMYMPPYAQEFHL